MALKTSASVNSLRVPGPGAYEINRELNKQGYSMRLKCLKEDKKWVPGPG